MIGHFATPAQLLQHALNCCQDEKVIMQNQIDVFEEQVRKLEAVTESAELFMGADWDFADGHDAHDVHKKLLDDLADLKR